MLMNLSNLQAGYGKVPILQDCNLFINEHETVAVIGPNGAGKSTLLKTISGLLKPFSGQVTFEGKDITGLAPDQVIRRGIAYIPEGGRPFPNMTVLDNLYMGAYTNRQNLKNGGIDELFQLFPILKSRSQQYARTLSGGERQMLAIARGLISKPKLLMLDEPSLGLAPKLVDEIYDKIRKLKETGLTVLLVEQNTGYALELADRGYVLENGGIVMSGLCQELSNSDHIKKAYLGI